MAKLKFSGVLNTAPRWQGEFGDRDSILPGGGQVNPFKFPAVGGIRQINSGTFLARRTGAFYWEPVNNDALTTDLAIGLTSDLASGATVLPVETTSGFKPGDVIDIGAIASKTIAANGVNHLAKTITITAALGASAVSGAVVKLHTAVSWDEYYLLVNDNPDANQWQDAELYRHGQLVYIDFLPGYPFTGLPAVLTKIKALYETQLAVTPR